MTFEPKVTLDVDGRAVVCNSGRPLLNELTNAGLLVATACGGKGICHLCRVTIEDPQTTLPPANATERKALGNVLIAAGMRLSCQVIVRSPLTVKLPAIETAAQRRERTQLVHKRRGAKKP